MSYIENKSFYAPYFNIFITAQCCLLFMTKALPYVIILEVIDHEIKVMVNFNLIKELI